ncbi:hypothetical protein EJ02DRAFT_153133 [Clathrospora elynae]|uniref:Uncharacterized protein n=1 Tax=Clathrospora elynae TaxID=706981 RepID=A0A6A5SQZ5_9PLEO|nr:hypothetical protein EJ02DRAFT_153133 [Clathrospora elynae]
MAPRKQYNLDDFTRYGQTYFPDAFAIISDISAYKFDKKTYVNESQEPHQVEMLKVGFYHRRAGGPSVWAYTTGSAMYYFWGNRSEEVLSLVPEENRSRIYYDGQFGTMAGRQDTKGITPTRKLGQVIVETVVNFLYLLTGQLDFVFNTQNTDMLGNLKHASMNLKANLADDNKDTKYAVLAQSHGIGTRQATPEEQGERHERIARPSRRVAQREDDVEIVFPKRTLVDAYRADPGDRPYHRSKRTSLLEHVVKYESQIDTELEQAKQAYQHDVATLQAKLADQEQRRRSAKELTKNWRLKCGERASEAADWKRKYERLQEKFAKSKERNRRVKGKASIKKEEDD